KNTPGSVHLCVSPLCRFQARPRGVLWNFPALLNINEGELFMSMDSLKDLYIDELKDLYNAENQLLKALPKMARKASAPELKRAFQEHLKQTEGHVNRL